MIKALLVVVLGLGLPGFWPAYAVARRSAALVFLAPLMGAGMVAVAAELELAVGGTLLAWYLPDYPPLVPAAGALAFALVGHGDLRVAIEVTALLNACALGVVGAGVAAVAARGARCRG